ncbi:hypothetical protein N9L92_01520 [Saprospiraceae bacterium]|nr:hypothetical protein [Saprospiraceae bacterium]
MDIKSVSKILKKINRLYELVNELGEASATEKDLLKAYVVDLYDAVITEDEVTVDLEREEMLKKLKKQKKLEKKLKKKKEKATVKVEEEPKVVAPPKPEPAIAQQPKAASVPIKKESAPAVSSALTALFEIDKGSEVSDKLSQRPIADLTRSMSINEKIFTVNELFGGNQSELDNILIALNGLSNYDEAKNVLIRSVAQKYNWSDASKSKKAQTFIKLVQRRYN